MSHGDYAYQLIWDERLKLKARVKELEAKLAEVRAIVTEDARDTRIDSISAFTRRELMARLAEIVGES